MIKLFTVRFVYKDGQKEIINCVGKSYYDKESNCFVYIKDNWKTFIPKINIKSFSKVFEDE